MPSTPSKYAPSLDPNEPQPNLAASWEEAVFQDCIFLAQAICQTPIAVVGQVYPDRVRFLVAHGLSISSTPHQHAFCVWATQQTEPLIVADTLADERFRHQNALVCFQPGIRFYAGIPLSHPEAPPGVPSDGSLRRVLAVMDYEPRSLSPDQIKGLTIIARQLGTLLHLRSVPGPLATAQASPPPEPSLQAPSTLPDQAAKPTVPAIDLKILVVEDTIVNQKVILKQLRRLGYQVDLAEDGQQALDSLAQSDYDLIFMDCQMPILDGYGATAALRRMEEASQRHTIVIAMTANATGEDRARCLQAGMDDYLSKPIFKEELLQKLEYWGQQIRELRKQPASVIKPAEFTPSPTLPVHQETGDTGPPLLVNWQHLDKVAEGDREFAQELLKLFLEGNQPNLQVLRTAIADQDFASIKHISHQIKGSSSNLGLLPIPGLAVQLEHQADLAQSLGMEQIIQTLEDLMLQLETYTRS